MIDGWKALATEVDWERAHQRLSWAGLARKARIGKRTIVDIAAGDRSNYDTETLAKLEGALHWERGSIQRVLAGRKPVRIEDPHLARVLAAWPELPPKSREIIAELAELHRP